MNKTTNTVTVDIYDVEQRCYSVLTINNNLQINFYSPPPNWWWRMWQWLLLGWKWKRL